MVRVLSPTWNKGKEREKRGGRYKERRKIEKERKT